MKPLKRYTTSHGTMCNAAAVAELEHRYAELEAKCAELESKCAKLLETIEAIDNAVKIGCPAGTILEIIRKYRKAARKASNAAIAKAERGSDEKDALKDLEEKKS